MCLSSQAATKDCKKTISQQKKIKTIFKYRGVLYISVIYNNVRNNFINRKLFAHGDTNSVILSTS